MWKLKSDINDVLDVEDTNSHFDYAWLYVDLEGGLHLNHFEVFDDVGDQIMFADKLTINLHSFWDLLNLGQFVTYQELPGQFSLDIRGANTTGNGNLFKYLPRNTFVLRRELLPDVCRKQFLRPTGPFSFELDADFRFESANDTLNFALKLKSAGFMDLKLSGALDNFSSDNVEESYISKFELQAEHLSWMQETIAKCAAEEQQEPDLLAISFNQQLQSLELDQGFRLQQSFIDQFTNFTYSPQSLSVSHQPKQTYNLRQFTRLPLHQIKPENGFSVSLNAVETEDAFKQIRLPEMTNLGQSQENRRSQEAQSSFIPVSRYSLSAFVGQKVKLNLRNRSEVSGVIEQVLPGKLVLSQYQYSGRSELPYQFNEIITVELIP